MSTKQYLLDKFKLIMKNQKLTHFYLIEGGTESEQKSFMFDLTYEFLKKENLSEKLKKLIQNFSYPNFYYLNANYSSIQKEQILKMQTYFSQTSLMQQKKVYVIEKAEKISYRASHSLLYFLENPINENILGILLTNNRHLLLPTIISRAQVFSLNSYQDKNILSKNNYVNSVPKDIIEELDESLIILLNRIRQRQGDIRKSDYYLNFKKFFLFFLEIFPLNYSFAKLFVSAQLLFKEEKFLSDFLFILTSFFLDLYYYQNNLTLIFPIPFLKKYCFKNNLSLEKIQNILYLLTQIEEKKNFFDDSLCFMFLLITLDPEQKEF